MSWANWKTRLKVIETSSQDNMVKSQRVVIRHSNGMTSEAKFSKRFAGRFWIEAIYPRLTRRPLAPGEKLYRPVTDRDWRKGKACVEGITNLLNFRN